MPVFMQSTHKSDDETHWLSVGDLMSGLMIIFLFISITYMRLVVVERDKIKDVIVAWEDTQDAVYDALFLEFQHDLDRWSAEIDRTTLSVRFREPDILFKQGRAELQPKFKEILDDFFPRYLKILNNYSNCEVIQNGKPRGCIEEIRIEGHTSTEWTFSATEDEAYFFNMELSQDRTRSVLQYCLSLDSSKNYAWLNEKISAVGFSSSHPITDSFGNEDKERSRRVEFRVRTTVERELMRVIKD